MHLNEINNEAGKKEKDTKRKNDSSCNRHFLEPFTWNNAKVID